MSSRIIRGNALNLPLADDSVDLVVTSPPYFGLRSYQDGGEHYEGQIGAEATPAEFVDALIAATREMVRVVKPSGSIWVNLGDKYAGGGGFSPESPSNNGGSGDYVPSRKGGRAVKGIKTPDIRPKSLIGIPWRYALRCIDDLGLILRAEVIWSKPNGLPESVTDRVRRSHEQWFHFTLNPRYYSAVDEVREEYSPATESFRRMKANYTDERTDETMDRRTGKTLGRDTDPHGGLFRTAGQNNPLGKLPGSVWTIPTEPLRVPESLGVDHFAAFPTEWPRRIITGWSPRGVCVECGAGRRPVSHTEVDDSRPPARKSALTVQVTEAGNGNNGSGSSTWGQWTRRVITGEACDCPEPTAPTTPGVVLDPFSGTGTTALVADALGRHGIGVDMSADYCRLAEWRTTDPKQRAKAARKPFTPAAEQVDGQASLLELIEEAI